jgi:hypothetical protein
MVVVAIMVVVAAIMVAAIMVAGTIMAVGTTMGEDLIIMAVTGVGVSGSALDGAGLDGVRGGVLHTTRTIRIMHHPPLLLSSNPRRMPSQGNRRRFTGIIATIQKVTTHMSRGVQTGGRRWRRSRLRLNSDGGHRTMKWARNLILLLAGVALSGCATMPTGPSVMVLPGQYKPFDVFQTEDLECRNWAAAQIGQQPAEAVNQNLAGGAAIGTLLGAGLGAAIGATSGQAGAGAAIGAASGLIGGTAVASGPAYGAGWELQRRYDNAYQQCMYAKGNLIPGVVSTSPRSNPVPPPPPPPGYTSGPPPAAPPSTSPPPPYQRQ